MTNTTLTLYGRADCHLCEHMQAALERLRPRLGFVVAYVDIASSPELIQRFGDKIPVLTNGAREICRYHLDEAALYESLASSQSG